MPTKPINELEFKLANLASNDRLKFEDRQFASRLLTELQKGNPPNSEEETRVRLLWETTPQP